MSQAVKSYFPDAESGLLPLHNSCLEVSSNFLLCPSQLYYKQVFSTFLEPELFKDTCPLFVRVIGNIIVTV